MNPEGAGGALRRLDDLEDLGEPAVRQAAARGGLAEPAAQHLLEARHLAGLALMRAKRSQLAVKGRRHVHVVLGLRAAGHPHLAYRPRRKALVVGEFGKRERVSRVPVDGVDGGTAGGAGVGMADLDAQVMTLR